MADQKNVPPTTKAPAEKMSLLSDPPLESPVIDTSLMDFLVALAISEDVRKRYLSGERAAVMAEFSLSKEAVAALEQGNPATLHKAVGGPGAYQYSMVGAQRSTGGGAAPRRIRVEVEIDGD
jgi:hypothetical protein